MNQGLTFPVTFPTIYQQQNLYSLIDSAEKPLAFDFESEGAIFLLIKL